VNKIMHAPISRLRDETDREAGLIRLEEARSLFALDETSDSDSLGDAPIQAASEVDLDSPLKDLHRTPGHGEPKTREEDGEEDS
jgi:hypothetical protein